MDRGFILYNKDLRYFRDIWDLGRNDFLEWEKAHTKFSLAYVYYGFWIKLLEQYGLFRDRIISQQGAHPNSQEWIGLYRNQEDELLEWVVSASYFRKLVSGQSNLVLRL